MKVLLVNGSPHKNGCVFSALSEIGKTLEEEGIESEIFHIGSKPVQGCTACFACHSGDAEGCVFRDELYLGFVERIKESDAIVIGAPVYYAGPPGALCAILDRVFFSASRYLVHKPAACVVNCRRGGASAAFDRLNKYFTILQMPVVSSQYWNSTHGHNPKEMAQDLEGMQTMRTLARNTAYLLKSTEKAGIPIPQHEDIVLTNFIR